MPKEIDQLASRRLRRVEPDGNPLEQKDPFSQISAGLLAAARMDPKIASALADVAVSPPAEPRKNEPPEDRLTGELIRLAAEEAWYDFLTELSEPPVIEKQPERLAFLTEAGSRVQAAVAGCLARGGGLSGEQGRKYINLEVEAQRIENRLGFLPTSRAVFVLNNHPFLFVRFAQPPIRKTDYSFDPVSAFAGAAVITGSLAAVPAAAPPAHVYSIEAEVFETRPAEVLGTNLEEATVPHRRIIRLVSVPVHRSSANPQDGDNGNDSLIEKIKGYWNAPPRNADGTDYQPEPGAKPLDEWKRVLGFNVEDEPAQSPEASSVEDEPAQIYPVDGDVLICLENGQCLTFKRSAFFTFVDEVDRLKPPLLVTTYEPSERLGEIWALILQKTDTGDWQILVNTAINVNTGQLGLAEISGGDAHSLFRAVHWPQVFDARDGIGVSAAAVGSEVLLQFFADPVTGQKGMGLGVGNKVFFFWEGIPDDLMLLSDQSLKIRSAGGAGVIAIPPFTEAELGGIRREISDTGDVRIVAFTEDGREFLLKGDQWVEAVGAEVREWAEGLGLRVVSEEGALQVYSGKEKLGGGAVLVEDENGEYLLQFTAPEVYGGEPLPQSFSYDWFQDMDRELKIVNPETGMPMFEIREINGQRLWHPTGEYLVERFEIPTEHHPWFWNDGGLDDVAEDVNGINLRLFRAGFQPYLVDVVTKEHVFKGGYFKGKTYQYSEVTAVYEIGGKKLSIRLIMPELNSIEVGLEDYFWSDRITPMQTMSLVEKWIIEGKQVNLDIVVGMRRNTRGPFDDHCIVTEACDLIIEILLEQPYDNLLKALIEPSADEARSELRFPVRSYYHRVASRANERGSDLAGMVGWIEKFPVYRP